MHNESTEVQMLRAEFVTELLVGNGRQINPRFTYFR